MRRFDRMAPLVRRCRKGAVAALAVSCLWGSAAAAEMRKVGDTAPTFTLNAVDGSTYVLSEVLRKRAVLVSFLSSSCKPCEDNIPAIAKIAGRLAREGEAEIVGIVLNGKEALVKAFEGQQPIC